MGTAAGATPAGSRSPRVDLVFRLWQCDKENHGWREGPPQTRPAEFDRVPGLHSPGKSVSNEERILLSASRRTAPSLNCKIGRYIRDYRGTCGAVRELALQAPDGASGCPTWRPRRLGWWCLWPPAPRWPHTALHGAPWRTPRRRRRFDLPFGTRQREECHDRAGPPRREDHTMTSNAEGPGKTRAPAAPVAEPSHVGGRRA